MVRHNETALSKDFGKMETTLYSMEHQSLYCRREHSSRILEFYHKHKNNEKLRKVNCLRFCILKHNKRMDYTKDQLIITHTKPHHYVSRYII